VLIGIQPNPDGIVSAFSVAGLESYQNFSEFQKMHTWEHFWQALMAAAGIASMAAMGIASSAAAELFLAKLYGHDWNAHNPCL